MLNYLFTSIFLKNKQVQLILLKDTCFEKYTFLSEKQSHELLKTRQSLSHTIRNFIQTTFKITSFCFRIMS